MRIRLRGVTKESSSLPVVGKLPYNKFYGEKNLILKIVVGLDNLFLDFPLGIPNIKPIWRTKVTDVRKNATSRTQRASSGLLSNSNGYQNYAAQKPYYTRPEDFKIPDYRTVKSNLLNGFQSNFQPNVFNQNNRYLQQQFVPDQKYFQPQFIPTNWHPSNQAPFYPQNNGFPNQNNIRNQWYIPPNALPYWEGAGPIPPQGAYGPTTSTKEPMKPSVNPENYEGTIPMQPSVNPEMVTTVSQNNHLTKLISEQPQHELYNPSTEVSAGFPSTFTSVMPTIFATQNNPFATSSTLSQTTSENTKTNIFLKEASTTPYLESFNEGYYSSETSQTHPHPIIALETTFKPEITSESNTMPRISTIASDFKEYLEEDSAKTAIITEPNTLTPQKSNTFYYPRPATSQPEVTSESNTMPKISTIASDFKEYLEEDSVKTAIITEPNTLTPQKSNTFYYPRPATSQVYQPPGQRPDEFTQHIDVNFIKPNRTCIWPTCGIDADKVSIYKPENGNGSRGPTLLISNVVKEIPGTYDLDKSTSIEPIHLEIPSGPHVFMPPQNFPAPSTQTQVPPSEVTLEITTGAGYSPTAKTIATSSSEIYSSFSSSSPHPTTSFQTTSAFPNTLPHFESTNTITELTTDANYRSVEAIHIFYSAKRSESHHIENVRTIVVYF
ncbi:hypothetical protein DICVIV_10067 [Dictyocaulus viviparus]|uniref:Uncharacterized protein n=1 Tax=Dictyocaulus viviparus TaxID=29172 RepID=A0A0D8XNH7_DICVI|nr:hypothetical protein DICVIV_10067 [Dictyocaulus viviparus]